MPDHVIPPGDKRAAPNYVADILKKDAADAASRAAAMSRPPGNPRSARWLAVAVALLVPLTAWNLYVASQEPMVATPAEELVTARFTVYLVAQEVEAHRQAHGMFPASLEVINADVEGITYTMTDTGYTLTALAAGQTLTYESGTDLRPFWEAGSELPVGGGQ